MKAAWESFLLNWGRPVPDLKMALHVLYSAWRQRSGWALLNFALFVIYFLCPLRVHTSLGSGTG